MKYDFVLMESRNWCWSEYNECQKNLANILYSAGYKVLVVNYLKNNTFHKDKATYDTVDILPKSNIPNIKTIENESNILLLLIKRLVFDVRRYLLFKNIFKKIKVLANNFYLGTYTDYAFPVLLLNLKNKNIFFWGIRSYYFSQPNYARNPYTRLKIKFSRKKILKNKQFRFFVSNKFIKDEFIYAGLNIDRIILRPERTIQSLPDFFYSKLEPKLTLLTLGFIRREKNLEFSINALKDADLDFIIAGSHERYPEYAKSIETLINNLNKKNIILIKGFLEKDKYAELISKSHFLLIADTQQSTISSNGTFLDAVFFGRPIIAPDHDPFKYYIDKYGIGITFSLDDKTSLIKAINTARELGTESFENNIRNFQEKFLLNKVSQEVIRQIHN